MLRIAVVVAALSVFAACGAPALTPSNDASVPATPEEKSGPQQAADVLDHVATRDQVPISNEPSATSPYALTDAELERATNFWGPQFAGVEVERYESLESMTSAATAVIVGRPIGVVDGPTVSDEEEPEGAAIRLTGYTVEVIELIAGDLPFGDGQTILLSAFGFTNPKAESSAEAVMFLRWTGEYFEDGIDRGEDRLSAEHRDWAISSYRLVSSQGLYLDGPEGLAFNPISSEGFLDDRPGVLADPVVRQAQAMTLNELIELVRSGRR